MVEGLPPNGALARKLAGHHWGHLEFLAADLVDLMAVCASTSATPTEPRTRR
jgi:hypothetical protein